MQRNIPVRTDVKHWSETRWLGCWNADDGVGLFLHAGRFRHDVELWWVQTAVYLPDGRLAVDRSWGRAPDDRGVVTSVFELLVEKPSELIASRFDGAMEVVTARQLAEHPRGSGGNSVPVRWELDAQAVREPWDMYAHLTHEQEWARGGHTQQQHRVRGQLTVGPDTYSLDGPGFDDHSHGAREWTGFGSHIFFNVPFEDFGLHAFAIQTPDGMPAVVSGAITRAGAEPDPVTHLSAPLLVDVLGAPRELRASVTTRSGARLDLGIELLHVLPITITETQNDNINGIDWEVPGDPLFLTEGAARYTTADGHVGYGHLERSARRSRFSRDTLAVREPWTVEGGQPGQPS
jgi:hypothetical protein